MRTLPTWAHGKGLRPLQPPVLLPAARRAQTVNESINFLWQEVIKVHQTVFYGL